MLMIFSELNTLEGTAHISIVSGEKPSVQISADKNDLDRVYVDSKNSELKIGVKESAGEVAIKVITNKPLKKSTLNDAGSLNYMGIDNNDELVLKINGSSNCNLSGKVNSLYSRNQRHE
jgi:hypothetical protein